MAPRTASGPTPAFFVAAEASCPALLGVQALMF
jgi:hypothetical protein